MLHTSRVTYLGVDHLKVVTSTEKLVNGNEPARAWSVHQTYLDGCGDLESIVIGNSLIGKFKGRIRQMWLFR